MNHTMLNLLAVAFQLVGLLATCFGAATCGATLKEITDLVGLTADEGGLALAGTYWSVLMWVAPVLVGLFLLAFGSLLRVAQQHGELVAVSK